MNSNPQQMSPGGLGHQAEQQPIHLIDYYHVLLRHRWTVVVCLLIMASLSIWHNARLIPIYRATSTLIIDKESMKSPLTGESMDYESYLSESMTFNTHFKLIKSRPVLERVIRDLKIDQMNDKQKEERLADANPLKQHLSRFKKNILLLLGRKEESAEPVDKATGLVQSLGSMVNIEPIEDTRLVNINVSNADPVMARDIANAVAKAYIDFNIDNRLKFSQNTLSWLTDHLYGMNKKLEDAEEDLLQFKQKMKLLSPEESQKIIAQKTTEFNEAYIQARNKRLELEAKLKQLAGISVSDGDFSHVRSLVTNPLISSLYSQLVSAEVERSRLGKVYKGKHPKMIEVTTQIDNTRSKIQEEIGKEIDNLKAENEVLLAREKVLQKTMADFQKEAMETSGKELNYTILKRNVEMNQNLYDTILSRLKEVDITGNVDVSNIRITEPAVLPTFPVSPNKKRNFIVGIIMGLMVGIGLSFLREYLDRSIHTEEDVHRYIGLPVLSVIPMADQTRGESYKAA
jgi:succinoglycan biosynthesis transport protein ExoP